MIKNNNKRGSFFLLLVRNYIVFTIAIVICLTLLFLLTFMRIAGILHEPKVDSLIDYSNYIYNGEYNKIPVKRLLGQKGFIEILDNNYNIVYRSESDTLPHRYTKEEIECIKEYNKATKITVQEINADNDKKNLSISITSNKSNQSKTKLLIIDDELNVIYSTENNNKSKFTKTELDLLTNKLPQNHKVSKFAFQDNDNKPFLLLIYTPRLKQGEISKIYRILSDIFPTFVIIYIILIALFIFWLNKKVRKPLELLNKGIIDFAHGNREKYLEYKGPKEFVEICDSFNEMSKQLNESEKEKTKLEQDKIKMLADISHDLKTPITVIKGYSKAICDGLVSENEKNQYLKTIYQKADGLTELINDFYDYSKMEHPNYKLVLEKVNICEYLRTYLAQKYDEIDINGFNLNVNIPEYKIFCQIDRVEFKRVFENIISNSLKHNKKGTTIYLSIKLIGKLIKITIADDGKGILSEISKNLFDPFVVGEKSRTNKGSGLGLAVVKRIITAHNGKINLVKHNKKYSTQFEIIIPII